MELYTREKNITEMDLIKNLQKNSKGSYLINKYFAELMKKNSQGGL